MESSIFSGMIPAPEGAQAMFFEKSRSHFSFFA
jgi:hypothetical protein